MKIRTQHNIVCEKKKEKRILTVLLNEQQKTGQKYAKKNEKINE